MTPTNELRFVERLVKTEMAFKAGKKPFVKKHTAKILQQWWEDDLDPTKGVWCYVPVLSEDQV
jgi:hypothetical protein